MMPEPKDRDRSGDYRAKLSFGCAALAGLYAPLARATALETLSAAWGAGLRRFDTAPFYGRGLSERRVGDFLRDQPRDDFVLSSKVGRVLTPKGTDFSPRGDLPFDVRFDYTRDGFQRSLEDSFQRLGMTRVDIVYVHDIGRFAHGAANEAHLRDLLESGIPYLEELKAAGSIRGWGLGVNEVEVCLEVMDHFTPDEILLAGRYTLLDRTAEAELLPLCLERGTKLVIGGVFNSGILATGSTGGAHFDYMPADQDICMRVDEIEAACVRHGLTLAQAALNFAASHRTVSHVLIGTSKVSSLKRNLDQFGATLPPTLLQEIAPFVLRQQTLAG